MTPMASAIWSIRRERDIGPLAGARDWGLKLLCGTADDSVGGLLRPRPDEGSRTADRGSPGPNKAWPDNRRPQGRPRGPTGRRGVAALTAAAPKFGPVPTTRSRR